MKTVFELFLAEEGRGHSEAWAMLKAPAAPWAVRDAVEKAQIREGHPVFIEIQKYAPDLEFLRPYMGPERDLSGLYALNAVARLLSGMDPARYPALSERLQENAAENSGPVSPARLYDLAASKTLFHTLGLPCASMDYTVLLELRSAVGDGEPVLLKLPATENQLRAAASKLGTEDAAGIRFRCVDCKVPGLTEAIETAEDCRTVNEAAKLLDNAPPKTLLKFKAALEALGIASLAEAMALYGSLDEYALEPNVHCAEDAARWELRFLLDPRVAEKLIPHVNLPAFGRIVIEDYGLMLTGYGAVSQIKEDRGQETVRAAQEGQLLVEHPPVPSEEHQPIP
ncbi:MAG: hypothetical protein IJT94_14545 [Oscillibacter sp.]|nr:hypothetical protein [Oscillibacter sp.]